MYDKAVDSTVLETGLRTIADAIRAKGGTDAPLEFPQGMADAVAAIEPDSGGNGGAMETLRVVSRGGYTPLLKDAVLNDTIKTIEIDCRSSSGSAPQLYNIQVGTSENPVVVNVRNCENRAIDISDYFRDNSYLKEVNFFPEIRMKRWWRLFYSVIHSGPSLRVNNISLSYLDNSGGYYPNNSNLLDITWTGELKIDTTFTSAKLTAQSVKGIIQHLADYSAGEPHTVTFSEKQKTYLDESDMHLATSRGWTIA